MTRTLLLHIGHYKTGTTAIQTFCQQSRDQLQKEGLNYAATHLKNAKHSALAFSLLRQAGAKTLMHGYKKPETPREVWAPLLDEVRASRAATTLVSSEELMRIAEFPQAAEELSTILREASDISVRAVVWFRPPGPHLDSWYNQLIKMRFPLPHYEAAVAGAIERIHYDYAHALAPWRDMLGREAIDIRAYPSGAEPHVLLEQALDAFGVPVPETLAAAAKMHNPRLDDRLVEAVRLLQNAGFPRHTVENAREQMTAFIQREDLMAMTMDGASVETIASRAATALSELGSYGELHFDLEEMPADIPRTRPAPSAEMLLASFVLTEFISLRRRFNASGADRIKELEARLEALERKSGDPS